MNLLEFSLIRIACVANIFARFRQQSWNESKKKRDYIISGFCPRHNFRYNSIRKRLVRRLYFGQPSCRPSSDLMKNRKVDRYKVYSMKAVQLEK